MHASNNRKKNGGVYWNTICDMSRVDQLRDKRQVGFAIVAFEFMVSIRFYLRYRSRLI